MRIPVLRIADGNEADDAIGTLALRAREQGIDATIVTADRDFFQLVRPGVTVMFNRKGISDIVRYDEQAVTERYGITPAQYLDFVALKGDTSDNIPGVPGVGDKTAAKLVNQFGTVGAARRPDRHAEGQAEGERGGFGRPARAQQGARPHRHRSRAARRSRRLRDGGVGRRRGAAPLHVARVPIAVRPAAGDRQREAEGRRGRARPARGLGRGARPPPGRRARPWACSSTADDDAVRSASPISAGGAQAAYAALDGVGPLEAFLADPGAPEVGPRRQGARTGRAARRVARSPGSRSTPLLAGYLLDPASADYRLRALAESYLGADVLGAVDGDEGEGQLFGDAPVASSRRRGRRDRPARTRHGRAHRPAGAAWPARRRGAAAVDRARPHGGTRHPPRRAPTSRRWGSRSATAWPR